MNSLLRVVLGLGLLSAPLELSVSCASTQGEGSETHFVTCNDVVTCLAKKAGNACIDRVCRTVAVPDAAVPDSGVVTNPDGSAPDAKVPDSGVVPSDGSAPDATGSCNPTDFLYCVTQCGGDFLNGSPECVDGQWHCPNPGEFLTSTCPADTCWTTPPQFSCCGPGGYPVAAHCPTPEVPECPRGSVQTANAPSCPNECSVPLSAPVPKTYAISIRFTNDSNAPVAMWQECFRHFEITGCEDGYTQSIAYSEHYAGLPANSCGRACPDTTCGCVGACQSHTLPVTKSAPINETWDGTLKLADLSNGCGCTNPVPAAPGRYRVKVPVYDANATSDATPLYSVTEDFSLGNDSTVTVTVPIDRKPDAG